MKYYAVRKGKRPGVYNSWDACKQQVNGYPGAVYKSFTTREEAEAFVKDEVHMPPMNHGLIAYVDGSFHAKNKIYGYGAILIDGGKVKEILYGKGNHPDYVGMRNVAGEIAGSESAVNYAIEHGYDGVVIYYDYMGIEKWAKGEWQANKPGTKAYAAFMKDASKKIKIIFMKVKAHSGDHFNDMADEYAKKAVGIL